MAKKEEIETLIKEKLKVNEIDRDATITTYGLDSLDVVEFLLGLEEKYGVTFDDKEISSLKTVGQLIDVIENKIK
ncbi:MAG: acyl carrier protein [Bacilli bacterium]